MHLTDSAVLITSCWYKPRVKKNMQRNNLWFCQQSYNVANQEFIKRDDQATVPLRTRGTISWGSKEQYLDKTFDVPILGNGKFVPYRNMYFHLYIIIGIASDRWSKYPTGKGPISYLTESCKANKLS
jgi:hypothetical protein